MRTRGGAQRAASGNNRQAVIKEWKNEDRGSNRSFQFTGKPGVKVMPSDPASPISILKIFIGDSLKENIVEYTNIYANILQNNSEIQERIANKNRSIYKDWYDTNIDEIWLYLTVILMMGITRKPEYHLHWSNDPFYETPIFNRLISRTRFLALRSMIHFSDPVNFDRDDPLKKIRNLIDELQKKIGENYRPERNICIDEHLSLWKGRLQFKIYIPSKRERYGVKIFMDCESTFRYLLGFIIYTGASTDYGTGNTLNLLKILIRTSHHRKLFYTC